MPALNWGGLGWTFWQWTDCSNVPGIAHCVDGDRLNGTDPSRVTIPPYPSGTPAVSSAPTVVGTAQAGAKLAGVPGVWSGGKPVTFTYQWQSCDAAGLTCAPIPGATLETYTPTATDVGHALVLTVTAASSEGPAVASSLPTLAIAPAGSSDVGAPRRDRRAAADRDDAGGPDADRLARHVDRLADLLRVHVAPLRRDGRELRLDRGRDGVRRTRSRRATSAPPSRSSSPRPAPAAPG